MRVVEQRTARMQALAASLASAGAALRDAPATSVSAESRPGISGVCFAKGSVVSGMNRICAYDCTGSLVTTNVGAAELCPLSYEP